MEYDILDSRTVSSGSLSLTHDGVKDLKSTKGWVLFLAIVGIVMTGLMVLLAIFTIFMGAMMEEQTGVPVWVLSLVYILSAGISIIPIVFMLKFSKFAKQAYDQNDNKAFNNAVKGLKSLFKSVGIITICSISVYVIAIFVIIISVILAN